MRTRDKIELDARVELIKRTIESRLSDQTLSVKALAIEMRLSQSGLRCFMLRHTGIGPKQYIIRARIRFAEQLLSASTLSVKEAMAAAGINDSSHFSRDFRRIVGVSPSDRRLVRRL